MKKAWLNRKYVAKLASRWTAGVFSFLGIIGTFTSLSDAVPDTWSFLLKLLFSIGIVAVVWLFFCLVCAIWFERKKWVEVFEANNDCHVYVQYGDIFSENEVDKPEQRRNVIIPVNRCFDTIVDNDLVSARTLHGITFQRLYQGKKFDDKSLNAEMQKDLQERQHKEYKTLTVGDKRRGNLKRYPVGTIAEFKESEQCTYFFMALSTFDHDLTAKTTQEEYVLAMQRMVEYCYSRSQGYPVVMPLIGAGMSKTKNSERAILEYTVKLLKLNKDLITSDIHIVVRNSGKETISITEL